MISFFRNRLRLSNQRKGFGRTPAAVSNTDYNGPRSMTNKKPVGVIRRKPAIGVKNPDKLRTRTRPNRNWMIK